MKMYILVRDDVPLGFAIVAVAHASLAGYLHFSETPEVAEWLSGPFFKAVCKVTDQEFEKAKTVADHVILTESALGGREVAIAFKPRADWPKMFKFFKLYRDATVAEQAAPSVDKNAQQGGTGQPATRPESDSEGSDKHQSESEGRSR